MPRRDLFKTRALPDVPFAENLVFYAPLTEGDLTDHVSGVSPVRGTGICEWDASNNAYRLKVQNVTTDATCLIYNLPQLNFAAPYNWTAFTEVYVISRDITADLLSIGHPPYNNQDGVSVFSLHEIHRFSMFTLGSWCKLVSQRNGAEANFYTNGTLDRQTVGTGTQPTYVSFMVENAISGNYANRINLGALFYNHTFDILLRDVRLYNRALTSQEIAML